MTLLYKLLSPWRTVQAIAAPIKERFKIKRISYSAKARAATPPAQKGFPVGPPVIFPGALPDKPEEGYMALDSAAMTPFYAYANIACHGRGFPGYPFLAELTTRSEYRAPSEAIAEEMTRKWGKVVSRGGDDKSDMIAEITSEMERHKLRDHFHLLKIHDGWYGRGQLYIQIKGQLDDDNRVLPLIIDKATIKKGSLVGFVNIEPLWTTPFSYNSNDPTAPDFFKPTMWYVLGKRTHATRLMTLVSRPVPDMLKPSFNFGGMSLSQLMMETVEAWIGVKASVGRIIRNFSITALKTDLSSVMGDEGGGALFDRLDFFNQTRDNQGVMALQAGADGEGEDIIQVNTPLSSLDKLQAQAQEHQAAVARIPLVVLTGITPSGLNASAEPEMDVFEDHIHASQERDFGDFMRTCLCLIQLDLYGEIDPDIYFAFEPLKEMNGTELAAIRKSDADAAVALVGASILSIEEERIRLASDPNSGYNMLTPEDAPPPVGTDPVPLDE